MSLKEALLECMEGTLSPDGRLRNASEERLKVLEATEHYGVDLVEVILEPAYSPPLRQLASVLLRQYVDTHWTSVAEKFTVPEPSEDVKITLKTMVPLALTDPNSKIRNSVASVISKIAHWDWPESWPNLFHILLENLKDPKGVQGAMRVLTELIKEVTDANILQVVPIILPEMLRILNDRVNYTVDTRTRAVEIFRTTVRLITSMKEIDKTAMNNYLGPNILEPFLHQFVACLHEQSSEYKVYGLQKSIVKAISLLLNQCPKKMAPFLQFILKPVWDILTSNIDEFRVYFNGEADDPDVDSDGEECGIEGAVFAVFGLIQIMLESPSMNSLVKSGLVDLIYYIIFYMQVPQERVESWISSPPTFAADEDEDNATYTLRVCAQDLLVLACDEFPEESYSALGQAVDKHLAGPTDWRLQEACLYAVCSLGTRIVKPVGKDLEGSPIPKQQYFNIHGFIQNIVFPGLSSADILLAGRCLVLGSNFCTVLTPDLTRQFVQAAAQGIIDQERNLIAKILAAKAIHTFVEQAKDNLTVKMALLEFIPAAVDSLINFAATQPVEISSDCLETMVQMLQLDEGFTAAIGSRMTTLAIACFVKFNGDPIICPTLEDMVRALCQNQSCVLPLQQRFTPTLVSVLNSASPDMSGAQGVALDLLSVIIKASPIPLSSVLMDAFPAVIHRVFDSDDHTVLQNGGECLRAFTATSPQQVYDYRDAEGNSGLVHVVELACRLLNPTTSEFSASFVGKLVTTLIMKTGDKLGDQLELLLRAVLSKLQSADTLSVIQNLCMVYAHLINTQMDAALNFLDSVPGPTGQSALHFVMTEWASRQQCFFGVFDRKVSTLALSKLLQHGVTQNDVRLSQIQVKGDPIPDQNNVRVTRSKSAGRLEQWTVIPLLVKIFKLLIHELSTFTYEEYESDTSDSDNEKENDTCGVGGVAYGYLGDELFQDVTELLDDPELIHDPIYSMDLESYIKKFLGDFSTHVYYGEFLAHLTPLERKVLTLAGITC